MDGESINSQSRGTSQQYNPGSTDPGSTGGSTGGREPSIEDKAKTSTLSTTGSTAVDPTVDPTKTDKIITDVPTTQVFGNPTIKTVSDDPSHPILTPSDGDVDQGSAGFDKVSDKNIADAAAKNLANVDVASIGIKPGDDVPSEPIDYSKYPQIVAQAAKNGVTPDQLFSTIQQDQNRFFEKAIQNQPPEVVAQLQAAYYMPNSVKTPSADIKQLLDKFKAQAEAQTSARDGVDDLQGLPVDSRNFLQKISQEVGPIYDQAFTNYVQSPDKSQLPPLDPAFQPQDEKAAGGEKVPLHVQQLISRITQQPTVDISQLQAKYNFEESFHPNPDIAFYNNVVNGDFAQALTKNVKGYFPSTVNVTQQAIIEKLIANPNDPVINSLPDDQKQQLLALAQNIKGMREQLANYLPAFLGNPDDPSIPDDVKNTLTEISNTTKASTIQKYGLDSDWAPKTIRLSPTELNGINTMQNGLDTANELLASAGQLVNNMPPSPEKSRLLNFLMKIATCLNELQNSIYAMQGTNTETSRKTNSLKLQIQLANLSQQQKAADDVSDKTSKMGDSGGISDFLKWVTNITIIALSVAAGPVGLALAIAYVTQTETEGSGKTFVADMCVAVNEGCQELGELMGCKDFGTILGGLTNFLLTAIVSMGNPLLFMTLFFQESKATENLVAVCGGDENTQKLTAQIMFMVVQVAFMVAVAVATMGSGTAAAMAGIAKTVAEATGLAVSTVTKIAQITNAAISITIAALTITSSGIEMNNNILLAQITMIKGKSESLATELEALIAVLKKLVDKLLASLQGMGDWTTGIGKDTGDLFSKNSSVTTDIAFSS